MRAFLGVNQHAPNLSMIGDLGWLPYSITKSLCLFNYWNRIVNVSDTCLTKKIFDNDYNVNGN